MEILIVLVIIYALACMGAGYLLGTLINRYRSR